MAKAAKASDQSAPEITSGGRADPGTSCQEPCDRSGGHEQIARDDRAGREAAAGVLERRPGHHGEAHGADRANREAVQGIARRSEFGQADQAFQASPAASHA